MAVTREQILAAADAIAAEGQRPTLEAVRQRVGGSYSTISPALAEWKAQQAARAQPVREAPPAAVAERLEALGGEVWAVALELATARLRAEREALEAARAELESERAEAVELADRQAAEIEALQSRLSGLEATEQAARQEADELRGRLAAAEARVDELRTELDRARQEAAQARQEATQAREDAAGLRGRIEALEPLLARLVPGTDQHSQPAEA
jgi:chromosome segregation ATPase